MFFLIVHVSIMIIQALVKWCQTPIVTQNDSNMSAMCLKIIGKLCLSEELSWQMIDKNGLMTYLEDGGLLYVLLLRTFVLKISHVEIFLKL